MSEMKATGYKFQHTLRELAQARDISAVREALAYGEAFRRLGFPADDIHWFDGEDGLENNGRCLFCNLRTQGKEFTVTCGLADDTTSAKMYDALEWWNTSMDQVAKNRVWGGSMALARSVELILALSLKGIRIQPRLGRLGPE